jgi:hypothetical protein
MLRADSGDERRFLDLVLRNRAVAALLERLPGLDLPDCYLVAGCLYQTVWNCLSGRRTDAHIADYDVFYHDPTDLSWEAEDQVIRRVDAACGDLGVEVQIRNQARVHLWYGRKFGLACPPLRDSRDSIDHFLNQSACVGIGCRAGATEIYAPFGFGDLFSMTMRPNPRRALPKFYYRQAARLTRAWPGLKVIAWPGTQEFAGVGTSSPA